GHAVGDDAGQVDRGGHGVVVVDGVEVAGGTRVPHERGARDGDPLAQQLLADLGHGPGAGAHASPLTASVDVTVATGAPVPSSATSARVVTRVSAPRARIRSTSTVVRRRSPAT